jgi:hypothetical protein
VSLFDLFRKEKAADLMAFLKEGVPGGKEGPGARKGQEAMADVQAGIEVEEAGGGLAPELEAAVLYANGKIGETAALLNRYLLDNPDNRDPQPWYMLFDLYEVSGQMEPFEDAAVDFAVKFERSPPTWAPRTQSDRKDGASLPNMGFGASFGPADRERLKRFLKEAADKEAVRVEVTRTPVPDEDYTRAILDCLVKLQEKGKAIKLVGGANLIGHLEALRQEDKLTEPGWLLLLTLLQLTADEARFEDVAVDYAVRFEVSPPSYTPPKLPQEADPPPARAPRHPASPFPCAGWSAPAAMPRSPSCASSRRTNPRWRSTYPRSAASSSPPWACCSTPSSPCTRAGTSCCSRRATSWSMCCST